MLYFTSEALLEVKKEVQLEIAHVLFIDIVDYQSFLLATNTN
jgi:hypothetical protein